MMATRTISEIKKNTKSNMKIITEIERGERWKLNFNQHKAGNHGKASDNCLVRHSILRICYIQYTEDTEMCPVGDVDGGLPGLVFSAYHYILLYNQ
jgi:hypothetical protein